MLTKFVSSLTLVLGLTLAVTADPTPAAPEPVKEATKAESVKGKGCCCCCMVAPNAEKDKADEAATIKANRAKLSKEDLALVEAQEYCVVDTDNRLGAHGVPLKLMVKDQAVFICCKGCEKAALADADKTLAKLKELKAKVAKEKAGGK
jgi:hypothetical protein